EQARNEHTAKIKEIEALSESLKKNFENEKRALEQEILELKEKEAESQKIWAMKESFDKDKKALENKIIQLNEQISLANADHEETSQRFKTAQQHLAKKVREAAIANE